MNSKEIATATGDFLTGAEYTFTASKTVWLACLSWFIPQESIISVSEYGPNTYMITVVVSRSIRERWGLSESEE